MTCRLYGFIWANADALSIESLGISLNQNIIIPIQENKFAYIVCKMVAILCLSQSGNHHHDFIYEDLDARNRYIGQG